LAIVGDPLEGTKLLNNASPIAISVRLRKNMRIAFVVFIARLKFESTYQQFMNLYEGNADIRTGCCDDVSFGTLYGKGNLIVRGVNRADHKQLTDGNLYHLQTKSLVFRAVDSDTKEVVSWLEDVDYEAFKRYLAEVSIVLCQLMLLTMESGGWASP